jgi:hypothetical protein
MRTRLPFLLFLICTCLPTTAAAQHPVPTPQPRGTIDNLLRPRAPLPCWYDRSRPFVDNAAPPCEPRVITTGVLAPSEADREMYAGFLSQGDTGLIRLLPRQYSGSKFAHPNLPRMVGSGAYYSFFFLSHEYGRGSDLELGTTSNYVNETELPPDHYFLVGFAGNDYGFLTNAGKLSLELLTLDDPNVAFMLKYEPARTRSQVTCEYRTFRAGVENDGRTYKSSAPIETDTTYLLRSIVYNKYDVLVAFRVVRQDPDASVTIAWKLLKNFDRPSLDPTLNTDVKCPIK